ncbi:MAG: Gfo/Idh/MocA family oxidoreductase [Selenomonadaceae bacterium]|nr:Gfo/Idh/MocA family oxidoreductase [Selenomonadaceae bacterium]
MNIAMLGTGKIVPEAIDAIKQGGKFNVAAIWARPHSKDKAEALAQKFNIKKVFTDYEELLADPEIEFVYVGLVNAVHYEYTKKALNAGKNVILEKPFTVKAVEAEELANLAIKKGLYLFEAVTLLHCPNFYKIRDTLKDLGNIKLIQCNYSQYSSRYDAYKDGKVLPAFDPKLYGGALYDINIYNINFIIGLFGAPKSLEYVANIGFNGIDTSGFLVLKYDNFIAHCTGAKDSESPSFLMIQGDNGFMRVNSAPNLLSSLEINIRGREVETMNLNQFDHRMVHEFIEFAETFENKAYDKMKQSLETSIIVVNAAETAIKNAGLHYGDKI